MGDRKHRSYQRRLKPENEKGGTNFTVQAILLRMLHLESAFETNGDFSRDSINNAH